MSEPTVTKLLGSPKDLGGMTVLRVLPTARRRSVGPYLFLDQMGPAPQSKQLDVRPHPHIGLATATYMYEGAILHRDSLGVVQRIETGAANWMTAGRGIVHSERSPDDAEGGTFFGLQMWLALPLDHEHDEPKFQHAPAESLPVIERDGSVLRVIAGEAYGSVSPVATVSPLFQVDAQLEAGAVLPLPEGYAERGAYVAVGEVELLLDGEVVESGEPGALLIVDGTAPTAALRARSASRVMLFGGAPLDAPRFIEWNFVASSKERLAEAKELWKAQIREREFPLIPGDDEEFIPLPG